MTQDYYGTKRITAWPQAKDGKEGYAVKYSDNYISWSPKDVFDAAYQPLNALSFGHAIEAAKAGHKIARSGWNGKGLYVELQVPDSNSKMTLPYFYLVYPDNAPNTPGAKVPWLASQTDVLADDWNIID